MTAPITKTVDVACAPARAFEIFVRQISAWWPLERHAVSATTGAAAQAVTVEPWVGGAVYETLADGGTSVWGKVLEFEDGRALTITWHPGTNPNQPTQVRVVFAPLGAEHTRVTLTHFGWEVWGDAAATKRDSYDGGWDYVLGSCYCAAVRAYPSPSAPQTAP